MKRNHAGSFHDQPDDDASGKALFQNKDKIMIDRYTRPAMKAIFDADHRLEVMFHVEKVSAKVLAEKGIIDQQKVAELLEAKVRLDPKRMDEIEETTRHDIISFLTMISEQLPDGARSILHYGMTSQDLIDTAGALLYLP